MKMDESDDAPEGIRAPRSLPASGISIELPAQKREMSDAGRW
jgi:hypothetical protein